MLILIVIIFRNVYVPVRMLIELQLATTKHINGNITLGQEIFPNVKPEMFPSDGMFSKSR